MFQKKAGLWPCCHIYWFLAQCLFSLLLLPTILTSNTIRLAVSELLLSPIQVGYITINYNTIASLPGSGMNLPVSVDAYALPSSTTTSSKQLLSVNDINAFIDYVSSMM